LAKEAINIKGTRNGLIILLDSDSNFEDLKLCLKNKMESARGFFNGAQFTLHHGGQLIADEKNELLAICKEYGLIPNSDLLKRKPENRETSINKDISIPGEQSILLKRTFRSGQSISYQGHITILGDIHPGAEIVAGGNVIIMGTCSGFVYAGAGRQINSFILALIMQRAHLRIVDEIIIETPKQIPPGPIVAKIGTNGIYLSKFGK